MEPELMLGSALGLVVTIMALALHHAGVSYRSQRLTTMWKTLEARCITLREEAEGHEALAREIATARAETAALQRERADVQRELEQIRAEAERRVDFIAEKLIAERLDSMREEERVQTKEAEAQKKAEEGFWFLARHYPRVEPREQLMGIHAQIGATLDLFWSEDREKERPLRHVMLKGSRDGHPVSIADGSCEFQGCSYQEWAAFRHHQDKRHWVQGPRFYTLFHYQVRE